MAARGVIAAMIVHMVLVSGCLYELKCCISGWGEAFK